MKSKDWNDRLMDGPRRAIITGCLVRGSASAFVAGILGVSVVAASGDLLGLVFADERKETVVEGRVLNGLAALHTEDLRRPGRHGDRRGPYAGARGLLHFLQTADFTACGREHDA